jgi:hypothetical protein
MELVIGAVISWVVAGLLGRYSPQIWLVFTGFFQPDLPKVSGSWVARYKEQDGNRANVGARESVTLRQIGRLVWGQGNVTGREYEVFDFSGRIFRNNLIGKYKVKGAGGPSGSGAFQVQISSSDDKMRGWCMWLDKDSDEIDASKYEWTRETNQ